MHFDGISYVDIHNQFKNVMENFDNNYYKTKMNIAHGIYVASDVKVAPHYNRALNQFYHSKIQVSPIYLNNYFDFHVRLSFRPFVRPFVRSCVRILYQFPTVISQNVTNKSCLVCV